jgi:pimeloyl-ACP methyl ester carboxylesterase
LEKTVTTVQVGNHPLDRFLISRVSKKSPGQAHRGTLLLLPPLGSGFQNYEVGDGGDYGKSFAGFFARRGFDVWGYSQRVQGLTAGTCESGAADCSAMAGWGLQTILDDVAFIRQQIELAHPGEKPVVGGLSLGSIASVAVINARPQDYAGAILLEGTLYTANPETRAINAGFCSFFDGLLAAGVFYEGQNGPGFKLLSHLAETAPNDPTPLPGFPPGFTNHRAWVAAMTAPPVGPTTPRPGYNFLAGSIAEDRFFYADESLVHANIAGFVDYVATRTIRDLSCGLAGERTFSDNLENFTGPVLMIAGGHGFGPEMLDTRELLTNATVTVNYREEYGHVDHVFSAKHLQEVEHPVLAWLLHEVP